MSARKVQEAPEEKAAWDTYITEQNLPLVKRLDKERTARSLPTDTPRTCSFCPATAWWEVEYISEWDWEGEAEAMDTCGEHLYTAFS